MNVESYLGLYTVLLYNEFDVFLGYHCKFNILNYSMLCVLLLLALYMELLYNECNVIFGLLQLGLRMNFSIMNVTCYLGYPM